jgi:putative tryptophan/tyrosine transport system substrate-binding protein
MRRRDFITLLVGTAAWPIAARAQSSIPVIGFINGSSATAYAAYVQAFIRGVAETGHTAGKNVAIEYRWAEGHYERIPEMVDELVRRHVAILAPNTPAALVGDGEHRWRLPAALDSRRHGILHREGRFRA